MASYDDNEDIKQSTGFDSEHTSNFSLRNPVPTDFNQTIAFDSIMPPRATMELASVVMPKATCRRKSEALLDFNQQCTFTESPDLYAGYPSHASSYLFPTKTTATPLGDSSEGHDLFLLHKSKSDLVTRRSNCKYLLELYAGRLENVRTRSAAILSRLVAIKLRASRASFMGSLPKAISCALTEEDTDSSTDDEATTQPMRAHNSSASTSRCDPNVEEHWLCTRSVIHSQWNWLLSEMKRSEQNLKNLQCLKSSFKSWKRKLSLQLTEGTSDEETCSRVVPLAQSTSDRHSYHDLASVKCSRLVSELSPLTTDPFLRCSCICGYTGPCIICCTQKLSDHLPTFAEVDNVDLLSRARPLSGHIHPKLSIPADVQLALRLESRLATTSNTSFREHKAATRQVGPDDKPLCLRRTDVPSLSSENMQTNPNSNRKRHATEPLPDTRQSKKRPFSSRPDSPPSKKPNQTPHKSVGKSSIGPSALRRILDLAPECDHVDKSKSWHTPDGADEQ